MASAGSGVESRWNLALAQDRLTRSPRTREQYGKRILSPGVICKADPPWPDCDAIQERGNAASFAKVFRAREGEPKHGQ
jgi:hypothetical protein